MSDKQKIRKGSTLTISEKTETGIKPGTKVKVHSVTDDDIVHVHWQEESGAPRFARLSTSLWHEEKGMEP